MIEFRCNQCNRAYSVPDAAAGKQAKCKCGAAIAVPVARLVVAAEPAPAHSPISSPAETHTHTDAVDSARATDTVSQPPLQPSPKGVAEETPTPTPATASEAVVVDAVAIEPSLTDEIKVSPPRPVMPPISIPLSTPPLIPPWPPASISAGKLPMRTRRLMADAAAMGKAFGSFDLIKLKATTGAPPEVYQIEYFVRGLERGKKRNPIPRDYHIVEIQLTSEYPRVGPKCRMLTPVFHPNIDTSTICVGDHWTAGERLADLAVRIGEMLAYQDYNIKSPLDAEAAMWADLNREKLPTDTRNVHPPLLEG